MRRSNDGWPAIRYGGAGDASVMRRKVFGPEGT